MQPFRCSEQHVAVDLIELLSSELPTPRNVSKWNVTHYSVNAAWNPVSLAEEYRVEMRLLTGDETLPVSCMNLCLRVTIYDNTRTTYIYNRCIGLQLLYFFENVVLLR